MVKTNEPLTRIPKKGQIAGVCAGLAEYFDFDVTLMRVIFVVLVFITGGGMILLYIILALILPVSDTSADKDENFGEKASKLGKEIQSSKGAYYLRNYLGFGIIVLGAWLLLVQVFPQWVVFRWDFVWPAILIIIGLVMIIRKK